jgi:phosphotransferase system  glucose/maltose/N-acetylglucosamine-specific IIC component
MNDHRAGGGASFLSLVLLVVLLIMLVLAVLLWPWVAAAP